MRALLLLLPLLVLPSAAALAEVGVVDAPGVCRPTTIDSEVCVGSNHGCTGVLFRAPRFDHYVCYGVYDPRFLA